MTITKAKPGEYADVICDAPGCFPRVQSLPNRKRECEVFLRRTGWRTEPDGKHSCPSCAGGENLERLRGLLNLPCVERGSQGDLRGTWEGEPLVTPREFTVKMRPEIGQSRVQLYGLVPNDWFLCSEHDLLVEVEVQSVVAWKDTREKDFPRQAIVLLTRGDMPAATFVTHGDSRVRGLMTLRVPARLGWNVIVSFGAFDDFSRWEQTEVSEYHVVVRVSSRPA